MSSNYENTICVEEQPQVMEQQTVPVEPVAMQEVEERPVEPMPNLQIDEEFRSLLPPLTIEELAGLEEDILKHGCLNPLIVWGDILIEGHNRLEICQRHEIPYTFRNMEFASRVEVKLWIIEHQFGRRNMNDFQRAEVVLKLKPEIEATAKARQGRRNDLVANIPVNLPECSDTRDILAARADVSPSQLGRIVKIIEAADDEILQKLRSGETTVHAVHSRLFPPQPKPKRPAATETGSEFVAESISAPLKKAIVTYTDANELCKSGQYNGKKLRKTVAKLRAAVDDLARVDTVIADLLKAGSALRNLATAIEILKHSNISVDKLKREQMGIQNQFDVSRQKLLTMKKFVDDEFKQIVEKLLGNCSITDEQDVLLEIQNVKFPEQQKLFEAAVTHATTARKLQVFKVELTEEPPPNDWFGLTDENRNMQVDSTFLKKIQGTPDLPFQESISITSVPSMIPTKSMAPPPVTLINPLGQHTAKKPIK